MAGQHGGPSATESDPVGGRRDRSRDCVCLDSMRRSSEPAQPEVITDKGTPFGDLLVPKLTSSVEDGAVG